MTSKATAGKRTCFEVGGHRTKDGRPCAYVVAADSTSCLHHAADKTRQREMLAKAKQASKEATTPTIDANDFQTTDDCLRVCSQIVKELTTKAARPDMRKLELILKTANSALQVHATRAVEKTNMLLVGMEHAQGAAILERLRTAPLRVISGRRGKPVMDVAEMLKAKPDSESDNDPAA